MQNSGPNIEGDEQFWVPGTVYLRHPDASSSAALHPIPTSDPNDPLNWSTRRKTLHFTLVNVYVFLTFVQLDLGGAAWQAYQEELKFTIDFLNAGTAYNYVGLALGCILFVPLVYKYGRRPLYIFSATLQLVACVLFAMTRNRADFIASNLLSGFGGAISETIAQITIADVFFVHEHAAMNGWFLFAQTTGATLGPVASGYVVDGQGWRWMWWWCVILFGINLVMVVFLFEESKYIPIDLDDDHELQELDRPATQDKGGHDVPSVGAVDNNIEYLQPPAITGDNVAYSPLPTNPPNVSSAPPPIARSMRPKTYRERMATITKTNGSIWPEFYRPLIPLFKFAAIAYSAVTFGTLSICFAVIASVMSTYLFKPPYNFSASSVGLMSLALFATSVPALIFGGYGNDKLIMWLSKRNGGVYEPEMRLWLALPMAIVVPGGILMSGLTISYGAPWPLIAVGLGAFGFGLNVINDAALSYAMDSYHDIIGSAMVGVVFVRNAASIGILFGLTPWIKKMGIRNMNIIIVVLCFTILLLPILLLIWGKRTRAYSAASYRLLAHQQSSYRRA